MREPTLLVDEELKGPFAYWRHRHEFQALDGRRTLMTDHVEYQFPAAGSANGSAKRSGASSFA